MKGDQTHLLDDLDFHDEPDSPKGDWKRVSLGIVTGVVFSWALWAFFFTIVNNSPWDKLLSTTIVSFPSLGYRLDAIQLLAWFFILLGTVALPLVGQAWRQPPWRIPLVGVPYSSLASAGVAFGREVVDQGHGVVGMLRRIFDYFPTFLLLSGVSYLLLLSVYFLLRREYGYIALPLLLVSALVLGFVR